MRIGLVWGKNLGSILAVRCALNLLMLVSSGLPVGLLYLFCPATCDGNLRVCACASGPLQ